MMTQYDAGGTCLVRRDGVLDVKSNTLWIDLLNPTPEEEKSIEAV